MKIYDRQVIRGLFAEQMPLPVGEGTYTQGQLAANEGVTDRTVRSDGLAALSHLESLLRTHDLVWAALDPRCSVERVLATISMLERPPRRIQMELTGRTWGRVARRQCRRW